MILTKRPTKAGRVEIITNPNDLILLDQLIEPSVSLNNQATMTKRTKKVGIAGK
jgi:hypothetical protein